MPEETCDLNASVSPLANWGLLTLLPHPGGPRTLEAFCLHFVSEHEHTDLCSIWQWCLVSNKPSCSSGRY